MDQDRRSGNVSGSGDSGSAGAAALTIQNLSVTLHRRAQANHALTDVSLHIGRGEIVALVGESGSGKSTLGLAVQGLLAPESRPAIRGSIEVDGRQIVDATAEQLRRVRRHQVGVIFQDPMTSLNPTMTIGRQLAEAIADEESAASWLDRVGITDAPGKLRAFPHELSGGQRQRVMIAMAMCRRPALVIADEPTTALDVTVQKRILALIRDLRTDTGTAFLFVTHDLSVAAEIADRIAVLYAGRLAEIGSVSAVLAAPAHPYTAALLRARFTLDANKDHQLPTLPTPSAVVDAQACAFSPRCLLATQTCRTVRPELEPVAQHAGAAACFQSDQVRPDLWERTAAPWQAYRNRPDTPRQVLTMTDVSKLYDRRGKGTAGPPALLGATVEVAAGESVALVGESGSGKSTLLRIVAGLVTASSGTVALEGDRPQMIYQDASASLTPWLSIGEIVGERLRRTHRSRGRRTELVQQALARVGLDPEIHTSRPHQLSGGQRQRVAMARATIVPPRLLLCDEPISAMDVSLAAAILNLLESLRRELGMAMLFVTHDLAAARFIADRILVMRAGVIVDQGPADQVITNPGSDYTRELLASMPNDGARR